MLAHAVAAEASIGSAVKPATEFSVVSRLDLVSTSTAASTPTCSSATVTTLMRTSQIA